MNKILACFISSLMLLSVQPIFAEDDTAPLPPPGAVVPANIAHFPTPAAAVVWKNWNLVPLATLAETLETTSENVQEMATLLGLPPAHDPDWPSSQNYICLVRRNWYLLPWQQILTMTGLTPERLAFLLKEDDFLWIKLGSFKPDCKKVVYSELTPEIRADLEKIGKLVHAEFPDSLLQSIPEEPRFTFIADLKSLDSTQQKTAVEKGHPRFIFSYFAIFGDPLLDDNAELYPDGLLQKLSADGVNGVWLHVVLRDLVAGGHFSEWGQGYEKRIANLRRLVERAKQYNIDVYLYMNEPRAMPTDFFEKYPEAAGGREGASQAMCTSSPVVQEWLSNSLEELFRNVPDLGGIFTITASENLTSCGSHGAGPQADCPRCKDRPNAEIIAEVNRIMAEAVHRAAPDAKVLVWDWGWAGHGDACDIIAKLPKNVYLMSVSEWNVPLNRGGVATAVGEYSLSAPGPGPRAARHWQAARDAGLKTAAKLQINTTWELPCVPYLPVLDLVARHYQNLAEHGVDGAMLSWSLGGYPSMNLKVAERFATDEQPDTDKILNDLASDLYTEAGREQARLGWSTASAAFSEIPIGPASNVYSGPFYLGPANQLCLRPWPTWATMVCFSFDSIDAWRGPYPRDVYASQCRKAGTGLLAAAEQLQTAADFASPERQREALDQVRYTRAGGLVYSSIANQSDFIILRDQWLDPATEDSQKKELASQMAALVRDEIKLAKEMFVLCREDSRIGFEASCQYWFVPQDLIEKVIACYSILDELQRNIEIRGKYANSKIAFEKNGKGHVAFLGGSITEMNGYRPMVCDFLQEAFPQTEFQFTAAGLSSTCSVTGAMRLERDVLSHGPVDLFFVEFAVNDNQDAAYSREQSIRGMEGIIRHLRRVCPNADIVMTFFVNEDMMDSIRAGQVPDSIAAHREVAQRYGVSTIDLASEVTERIDSRQLTWEQYGGVHPAPAGNRIPADMIKTLLRGMWEYVAVTDASEPTAHTMPDPIDSFCLDRGMFLPFDRVQFNDGWKLDCPDWSAMGSVCRDQYNTLNILHAEQPGAVCQFEFEGTAVGAFVLAGPDAGALNVSIDGQPSQKVELYHERYSPQLHYPRTVLFADELPEGKHTVEVTSSDRSIAGPGSAVRIIAFVINGK
ncbi:MAG: GDSL-type esterase/lipase family protein [Planctomycetia bacterium]|nr:GDSL-type esterase/lipase family protein [Planctomycetia bacterium]